jgi:predicted RNase H-like HicB family nuclease
VKYVVVYERTPNNWSAYVPDLPGCVAVGDTREETRQQIAEAITFHLESLREYGDPIPQPGEWTDVVEVGRSTARSR